MNFASKREKTEAKRHLLSFSKSFKKYITVGTKIVMSKETKKNRKFYHFFGVHSKSNEGRIDPAEFLVVCIDFLINVANFLLLAG